jgi:ketosteroid isomerase-like protein
MSSETTTEGLTDREQIKELRASYCYAIDNADWETFNSIFIESPVLDYGARIGRREGQEGIKAVFDFVREHIDASSHMITNPKLEVDGDTATGRWYVDARESFTDGTTGITQGEYNDIYHRVDGEWKIAEIDFDVQYQFIFDEDETIESIKRQ